MKNKDNLIESRDFAKKLGIKPYKLYGIVHTNLELIQEKTGKFISEWNADMGWRDQYFNLKQQKFIESLIN